ncbi:MAG: bifunctional UDP-N-acetylglucosamine pyrophosphorylase / Glucosamine-1-phosphate N-acetyltransferase [Parcubacteria bacterium C7867-008]|nr:MAG: bifunctional UDP-N-acetylglucosamine pyrophosphorylase / Glucosamine-1-phosphate N-acetyltransferase [Parcubacteria bacterium C7867-008]
MQVIILAAGRGTRMGTLTDEVPKPMLKVHGKTLLEHKFDILPADCEEIILIVGYKAEVIRNAYGDSYKGIPIRYIVQETLDGTGGAVWLARPFIKDRFAVLMGDDIYGTDDLANTLAAADWALLVERTENMAEGGIMVVDENNHVLGIEEGDHRGKAGVMNTNLFVLDTRVFEFPPVPKTAGSSEYGLPQTVVEASKKFGIPVHAIDSASWIQVTAPEDVVRAESLLPAPLN